MKNVISLLIFLVFSISIIHADDFPVDISVPKLEGENRIEIAKNLINDLSKRGSSLSKILISVPDENLNRIENEVCVSCEKLIPLAQEVNNIIQKQAESLPNSDELKIESRSLEGVISYMRIVDENGNRECHKIENFDTTKEFRSFSDEELVFIFRERVSGHKMRSAMYATPDSQVAFFRGKGKDADKLVRVDMDKNGEAYITYYQIKNVKDIITYEEEKRKLELDLSLPSLGGVVPAKEKVGQGVIDSTLDTNWSGDKGHIKASIGPRVEYNNFLPKKVTLVEIDNELMVTDETILTGDAEVTNSGAKASVKIEDETIPGAKIKTSYSVEAQKQTIGVSLKAKEGPGISGNVEIVEKKKNLDLRLVNKDENPYVYMKLKDEGDYLVGLPYKLESGDYGIGGEFQYQDTGEKKASMSIMHQGKSMVDTSIAASEKERKYTISKSKQFKDDSTLSVSFSKTQNTSAQTSENSFWLSYQKRF